MSDELVDLTTGTLEEAINALEITIIDASSTTELKELQKKLNQSLTIIADAIITNAANIATNVTDIATNVTDIATNVTDIATNVTDIATNVTDIGTNDDDIATNADDISTHTH